MMYENLSSELPSMAKQLSVILNLCILLLLSKSLQAEPDENGKVYVVYMGHNTLDDASASSLHLSMLEQVIGRDAANHMLQRYTKSFHGFSARLTQEEAKTLSGMDGVVSVFPSRKHKLATTSSWDFLGFPLKVNRSTTESDIIIGVIDSGIWPESPSFTDMGYGPPPAKWKGICEANFTCNNKIIGARHFKADGIFDSTDFQSPRDSDGHGTHTASTAAGNIVRNANQLGLHSGTARGGVPRARIAVYKACWLGLRCSTEDILSAFDAAIADGVDLITVSAGSTSSQELFADPFSIGSFHAMKRGILTVQSASNEGPNPETLGSLAPWILTVGASTKNPDLITPVRLGNGVVVNGVSINSFTLDGMYPLIYAGDVPNITAGFNGSRSRFCLRNSLDKNLVKGKIILCDQLSTGEPEMLAGAVGSIMTFPGPYFESLRSYTLPVSVVNSSQATTIARYIKSTRNAIAVIMKSEDVANVSAPIVASFSSRGPNPINPSILKPDLTAPGVRILAAWSPVSSISQVEGDRRAIPFNMISGTSMACPHVAGIAAYIKTFNPAWSPAAIKSALMTTASAMSAEINTDAEFAYGAGNLNPLKAMNPGLVYDAAEVDYVRFLCEEGYSSRNIRSITGVKNSCSQLIKQMKDLNYPTFVARTMRNQAIDVSFNRTVTNVGTAISTYRAVITQPPVRGLLSIEVEPNVLRFQQIGQKLSFTVSLRANIRREDSQIASSALTWDDGVHTVRSPIVVHVP